jgi:peroxiredoxin
METTAELTSRQVPRTTWALLGIFVVVATVGVATAFAHHRTPHFDPLNGDMDTATGAVADILKKTPEVEQTPLLLTYLQRPNPGLRYAAVDALGDQHGPQVRDAIAGAFTDSASIVRQRAMEVLPKLDSDSGLRLLLTGLKDDDLWVRQAAATQLDLYDKIHLKGIDRALPTLVASIDDPDLAVSNTAMHALRKITGKPWRVSHRSSAAERAAAIANWQTWWAQNQSHYVIPTAYDHITPISPTRSDPAPDFSLSDTDGHSVSLAAQHGKVTLLNFWGTWCPPCQQEVPDLVKLDQTYRGRNVEIIGIALSEREGAEGLRRWCNAHGIAYRQALSTDEIQDAFGHIEEVPVSVLIDAQGQIRYRWEGERDYATFSKAIDHVLAK